MPSLPPPDLGGPLPLQINRLGHAVHGLCKNGTVTMANGLQQDGYAFPGTGFCYAVSVPGFVAGTDPDAATEQAAGRYWLPYAIVSGGQLYGQQLMTEPGYRGDAAVFMSFGTNRNLAITIPGGGIKAIWWTIWPSQQIHSVTGIPAINEPLYWKLLDVAGHRAVFAASTVLGGDNIGMKLWSAECRFFEMTVTWPVGGTPQISMAELPNTSSLPTQFNSFTVTQAVPVEGGGLELRDYTQPARSCDAQYGMTANRLAIQPMATNVTAYYPHDHTYSRIVGYAYRDDQPQPITCEAHSVLTQDYACVPYSYLETKLWSVRVSNKVHRRVTTRITFGGAEVISAVWDKDIWDSWVVMSATGVDADSNGKPLQAGGGLNYGDDAVVWMGCYSLARDLLVAAWSDNESAKWQLVDVVTGQKLNQGSLSEAQRLSFQQGNKFQFVYASKHPVTGQVAVSVPAAGSTLAEQLCWV
ncbi:hypothetical protein DFR38_10530 [Aquitalea magnusonii]|uniref:Uncharacterized protein n=2 Tax=Aquitalea magnusonii TaxID=332411 RepID=A0A318K588_9NEIS|nr:hypothetical protein DFR38_10530 [Aquitalea magnusonii]